MLRQEGFKRRRVTTTELKNRPAQPDVQRIMKEGQAKYINGNHTAQSTFNMDQTAIFCSIGPVYQCIPEDQVRAGGVATNQNLRMTVIIAANGEGTFALVMFIIKHYKSKQSDGLDDDS